MAQFIHSILAPNQVIAADGMVAYDLPVNPLSCIYLHISPLNETGTITTYQLLQGLLSAVDNIDVLFKGVSILSFSGIDLLALLILNFGIDPIQSNIVNTDNDRRSLILPIPLGRRIWNPNECFPRSIKGELTLQITWDIADTGFDALRISIETLELPDANPTTLQKITTLAQTLAATGQNDVDLPIGNVLRGILCFGTTGFAGATPAPTLGQMSFFMSNQQQGYSGTDFEVSRQLAFTGGLRMTSFIDHIHSINVAALTETDSRAADILLAWLENYTLLTFDPTKDDEYAIDTAGSSRIHLRISAETANAIRILPIERMDVSRLPSTT